MRRFAALALLIAAAGATATCGGGGATHTASPEAAWTPLAMDLAGLRERASAAVTRDGQVFHTTARSSMSGIDTVYTVEIWLDLDHDVSRMQAQAGAGATADDVRVYYNRRVAMLGPGGRLADAAHDSPLDRPSLVAAPYLQTIFRDDLTATRIETSRDGAMRLVADGPAGGENPGTEHHRVELDAAFLPVRTEVTSDAYPDSKTRTTTTTYTNEFVSRQALSESFFSPDAVRALATTPLDELNAALTAGLQPYWLGASYEGAELARFAHWAPASGQAPASLELPYGPPGDGPVPVPCVSVAEYRREDWELLPPDRRRQPGDVVATFLFGAGSATIYAAASGLPAATPYISGGPTPPPLPSEPDDHGDAMSAVVLFPETAVVLTPNCGPVGTNAFRTPAGFERLVRALVPFSQ